MHFNKLKKTDSQAYVLEFEKSRLCRVLARNYTSTVDENAFNKAAEFLNQTSISVWYWPEIGYRKTMNWKSHTRPISWYRSLLCEYGHLDLYELLRERDNEQKQEKVASLHP